MNRHPPKELHSLESSRGNDSPAWKSVYQEMSLESRRGAQGAAQLSLGHQSQLPGRGTISHETWRRLESCFELWPCKPHSLNFREAIFPPLWIARPKAQQALRSHVLLLLMFQVLGQTHRETPRHLIGVCALKIWLFWRNKAIPPRVLIISFCKAQAKELA